MLQNSTNTLFQGKCLSNAYSTYNNITPYNSYDTFLLTTNICEIINSTEKKHDGYREKSAQSGFLKRLLTGVAIVTGMGVLVTGCYYRYTATERIEENYSFLSSESKELPPITDFAYSYYKDLYNNSAKKSKDSQSSPGEKNNFKGVSTESPPADSTTTSYFNTSDKPSEKYNHKDERNVYYKTVPKDVYYPFGEKLYIRLANFCVSYVEHVITQACSAPSEIRYELLRFINSMIEDYIHYDVLLREFNAEKKALSIDEHAEEIITRRKLTTLLLAAEHIIEKKDIESFYSAVKIDLGNHSMRKINARYLNIRIYLTTQNTGG